MKRRNEWYYLKKMFPDYKLDVACMTSIRCGVDNYDHGKQVTYLFNMVMIMRKRLVIKLTLLQIN